MSRRTRSRTSRASSARCSARRTRKTGGGGKKEGRRVTEGSFRGAAVQRGVGASRHRAAPGSNSLPWPKNLSPVAAPNNARPPNDAWLCSATMRVLLPRGGVRSRPSPPPDRRRPPPDRRSRLLALGPRSSTARGSRGQPLRSPRRSRACTPCGGVGGARVGGADAEADPPGRLGSCGWVGLRAG